MILYIFYLEKQCDRVSEFCWGILDLDKDKPESDQRLSWVNREKLIFKMYLFNIINKYIPINCF